MRIMGILAVRENGTGKIDTEKTEAAFILRAQEQLLKDLEVFRKELADSCDNKHDEIMTRIMIEVLDKNFSTVDHGREFQRATIVGLVTPELVKAGLFKVTDYRRAEEAVENFIADNACNKNDVKPDTWFIMTTGKGRGGGKVWEQRRPSANAIQAQIVPELTEEEETDALIRAHQQERFKAEMNLVRDALVSAHAEGTLSPENAELAAQVLVDETSADV